MKKLNRFFDSHKREPTQSTIKMPEQQNFDKTYSMVSPQERRSIISRIDNNELVSEILSISWKAKHHPSSEVPASIYLLGDGTIQELFDRYHQTYREPVEWGQFMGYTREMFRQGIMQ